ncbi:MAG: hypothetical protein JJ931_06250 [Henriciella sp.]|nr:hypothetical protein [Henriciella sp.]MBO6694998.1 hypothetical protein [Henriciella sp.]
MIKKSVIALLSAAALTALPTQAAFAQAKKIPQEKLFPQTKTPPIEPLVLPRATEVEQPPEVEGYTPRKPLNIERFSVEEAGLRTSDNAVHRGPIVAALAGFEFYYRGAAHQIRRVKTINNGEHISVDFRDRDGNDMWDFNGRYVGFPGREDQVEIVTLDPVRCPGRCSIRLLRMDPSQTAVLVGFEFYRTNDDANLEAMSIQLLPDREIADVYFYDDNGIDASGFFPFPGVDLVTAQDVVRNQGGGDTMVTLQYMIIPRDWVFYSGRMIGGSQMMGRTIAPGQDLLPKHHDWGEVKTRGLMMGFGFAFGNGDHHIKAIKADLTETPVARFQDGDTDDPMGFFIDYAVLQDTAY